MDIELELQERLEAFIDDFEVFAELYFNLAFGRLSRLENRPKATFLLVLLGFIGIYWDLLRFIGIYWYLLVFIGIIYSGRLSLSIVKSNYLLLNLIFYPTRGL
jgi:hypothetical protein